MNTPTDAEIGAYIGAAGKAAWEVPDLPANTKQREIKSVGIIGAGTMGGGIAMNFATAGIPVTIVETTQEALDRGLKVVRGNYQRSADKGRFPQEEVEARMDRFDGKLELAALAECDLVIEAVFEDMELKRKIFTELDRVMKPGAILATNTSALNIDEIAAMTKRPEDVIGLHFFSPANVMKLLEIVRAKHTADDVVATSMDLAAKINKIAVLVGVCPGFVGNRILFARQKQANKLLQQGLMPWDVDAALNAFGFKMGPFQMSDLAGLDIGWSKGAKTENPIRDALCEMDRRGQKTQAGFYDYDMAGDALELVNRSAVEYHNLAVFAISPDDTRSLEEFAALSPEELESQLRDIGHLDAPPGEAAFNGRIRLQTAGRYLALDMVPEGADPAVVERLVNPPDPATADSPPWLAEGGALGYQHGMITEFTVVDR